MKAIIIQDEDSRALLDQLKLEKFNAKEEDRQLSLEDMHRRFHYIVCRWLQEQGANVVR